MRPITCFLLASSFTTLVGTRPADACSCGAPDFLQWPPNGATNLPRNAALFVWAPYEADPPAITLRDAQTGNEVALELDVSTSASGRGPWIVARPAIELEATTTYEVTVTAGQAAVPRTFTTGSSLDNLPPAFAGLTELVVETMENPTVDSCFGAQDVLTRLQLSYDRPAEVVFLELALYRAGDGALVDQLALAYGKRIGYGGCDIAPRLTPGEAYCGRVIGYDAAGNPAGGEVEACSTAAICRPLVENGSPSPRCEPSSVGSAGCQTGTSPGLLAGVLLLLLGWARGQVRARSSRS
jgi:hypothetical protein